MEYTKELEGMQCVGCIHHENAPIPQEGKFEHVKEVNQISGFSHSVGTCGLKQGACKLSLNIKNGIIQECVLKYCLEKRFLKRSIQTLSVTLSMLL